MYLKIVHIAKTMRSDVMQFIEIKLFCLNKKYMHIDIFKIRLDD